MKHKTIFDKDFEILESDHEFNYQKELTENLDSCQNDFTQNKLNEIVLWKVSRYADFSEDLIALLNSINPNDNQINKDKTTEILKILLRTKGVQMAMASTILRFRNRKIYQIIDQRVYRIINPGKVLKLNTYQNEKNINDQIQLYFEYLEALHNACVKLNIPFEESDRILFMADRRINKQFKINH